MLKKVFSDKFFRHNAIVFAGSMTAAFLNYLFHPVLSRLMSVQDFGEVQALLSLSNNLMFLGIFGAIVVNIVANTDMADEAAARERMAVITALNQLATALSLLVFVAVAASSLKLQSFFQFHSYLPFLALAPAVLISVSTVFRRSYLRGVLNFKVGAVTDILVAGGRLCFAAFLVWLGLRAFGVMIGVVLAMAGGWLYVYASSRRGFAYVRGVKLRLDERLRSELRFGLLILVVTVAMTAAMTADVLVVKHYFAPAEAGLYSGIATIARIVIYVTGSVTSVMASSVRLREDERRNRAVLAKALGLTLLLGGSVFAVFVACPHFVISILIGSRYDAAAALLPRLSLFMLLLSLVSTLFSYHQALRHNFIAIVGLAGLVTIFGLAAMRHAAPAEVVQDFTAGALVMLLMFAAKWLWTAVHPRTV